jgi:hypothetical protein
MTKRAAVLEKAGMDSDLGAIERPKMVTASFDRPAEVRKFPKGHVELVNINGAWIGRGVFEPGWKWSTSVKKIAKTRSCTAPHFQYHVSGRLMVRMDDGTEKVFRAGDVSYVPSGHDAWVLGDEPAVVVDFQGMRDYGRSQT